MNAETGKQLITRFDQAIYGLLNDQDSWVADHARSMIPKIGNQEVPVTLDIDMPRSSHIVRFTPVAVPGGTKGEIFPSFAINPANLLSNNKQYIQAELISAFHLADLYPFQGYERRMLASYGEALALQKKWLTKNEVSVKNLDPRIQSVEDITKAMIGEAYYYSDTGFTDWQKAIDEYVHHEPNLFPILEKLRESKAHFLSVRQNLTPMLYDSAILAGGKQRIQSMDQEEIANLTAFTLLGISLTSFPPTGGPSPIH